MAGTNGGRSPAQAATQDAWVEAMLGIRPGDTRDVSAAAERSKSLLRARPPRPEAPPSAERTGNLIGSLTRLKPGTPEELPGAMAPLVPRFLVALQSEPALSSAPGAPGAPLSEKDKLLMVADSFNAVMRAARRWESLLEKTDAEDSLLDKSRPDDPDRDAMLDRYNSTRTAALRAEEQTMAAVSALTAEYEVLGA